MEYKDKNREIKVTPGFVYALAALIPVIAVVFQQ